MKIFIYKLIIDSNLYFEYVLVINPEFRIYYSHIENILEKYYVTNKLCDTMYKDKYDHKLIEITSKEHDMLVSEDQTVNKMVIIKLITNTYGNINS
jgi:hypothetical protein